MTFHLPDFLPYLLNQAAEASSQEFQRYYRQKYGMLRTEWRVLFHLGCYGEMTAKEICMRAGTHKTKVSRAVGALERKRHLARTELDHDRRNELLSLTPNGKAVFADLSSAAEVYDRNISAVLSKPELDTLRSSLRKLAERAPATVRRSD